MTAAVAPPVGLGVKAVARTGRASTALEMAALVGIVAGAAFLRAWGLARQGFWYDEAMTAWLVRETPGQLLTVLPHTESTPPLYYMLAWAWVRLFGNTEVGLRSLSVIAGTAAVPAAYLAAREMASRRAGLVTALLVAGNPLLVWYSQEARAYSLFVLLAGVSFWLFARARTEPTPQRLVAWALLSVAALCTHYFAIFVVAPEAVWLLAGRRAALKWRLAAVGIVGCSVAALAGLAWMQRAHASWQGAFGLRVRAEQVPDQLLAGFSPPATTAAHFAIGAAALGCLALGLVLGSRRERLAVVAAGAVAATAIVVPVAIAAGGVDYVDTRNAIAAVVPLAVALGVCAATRGARRLAAIAVTVIAVVSLALVVEVPRDLAAQRPHWRVVAAALAAPRAARRAILIRGSSSWALPLAHYLPRTWWAGPRGVDAKQIDVLRKLPVRAPCRGSSWWGASCAIRSRPSLGTAPARGFRLIFVRDVAGFSIATYRSRRPVRLYERPPLEVRRPPHPGWHRHKLLFSPVRLPPIP